MVPQRKLPPHSTILEDAEATDTPAAASCSSGDDIFDADPPPKTKIILSGVGHDDISADDRKVIRDVLIDLIAADMEYPLQNITIEDA